MEPPTTITDLADPRIAVFRQNERGLSTRVERRDDSAPGRFLAEGDLLVERALDAGCRPVAALVDIDDMPSVTSRFAAVLGRQHGGSNDRGIFAAGEALRREIVRMGRVQAIVAVFERPPRPPLAEILAATDRVVVMEAVDNPANVGAIVRNAAALGWGGTIADHTSADPLARRALRVAMGTAFEIPHGRTAHLAETLAAMNADGWMTFALCLDTDADDLALVEPGDRCAIVLGAERAGLSDPVGSVCLRRVRIPMNPNVDSLNVASASAIACYALRRR